MKLWHALLLLCGAGILCPLSAGAQERPAYYDYRQAGEAAVSREDYASAYQVYLKASLLPLSAQDARWAAFRLADVRWRSVWRKDQDEAERAVEKMRALFLKPGVAFPDRTGAFIRESIGDYYWTRNSGTANWTQAIKNYEPALRFWINEHSDPAAPEHAAALLAKMAHPAWFGPDVFYGTTANFIGVPLLHDALKACRSDDAADIHYLLARTLAAGFRETSTDSAILDHYEQAIRPGPHRRWRPEALLGFSMYLEQAAAAKPPGAEQNSLRQRAAELRRDAGKEGGAAFTAYNEKAQQLTRQLQEPALRVSAQDARPGMVPDIELSWSGVPQIDLSVFRINLLNDLSLASMQAGQHDWLSGKRPWFYAIDVSGQKSVFRWKKTFAAGEQGPSGRHLQVDNAAAGAYLAVAESPGGVSRAVFVLSNIGAAIEVSGGRAAVLCYQLETGEPVEGAAIRLWERKSRGLDGLSWQQSGFTSKHGVVRFPPSSSPGEHDADAPRQFLAIAVQHGNQAYATVSLPGNSNVPNEWTTRVILPKTRYCGGETLSWVSFAQRSAGTRRSHDAVRFRLVDPSGNRLLSKILPQREFGEADGSAKLGTQWSTGTYTLTMDYQSSLGGEPQPLGSAAFTLEQCPANEGSTQPPAAKPKK